MQNNFGQLAFWLLLKRGFAILISLVVLISGMHLTFAVHFCGGKAVASKISLTGSTATCGMAQDQESNPVDLSFKSGCCQNHVNYLKVDNYEDAPFQLATVHVPDVQIMVTDFVPAPEHPLKQMTIHDRGSPPGSYLVSSVNLSSICVFRI